MPCSRGRALLHKTGPPPAEAAGTHDRTWATATTNPPAAGSTTQFHHVAVEAVVAVALVQAVGREAVAVAVVVFDAGGMEVVLVHLVVAADRCDHFRDRTTHGFTRAAGMCRLGPGADRDAVDIREGDGHGGAAGFSKG